MSDIALNVENIEKRYLTFKRPMDRLLQRFYRNRKTLYSEFHALKDISFQVHRGETMGIIGQNGSGKSTLLQIIAGTLMPTSGKAEVNGRIAALLELGAGFNPEFNGIENAKLNASIMGINQEEFKHCLDEIIEFSGLGDFIYKPVKTYSSGMYVRLAFSVSVSLKPDILIIDEALGVGDARFQRKCFRKLEQLKDQGVTILFVSHALDSIVNHCDRAIFINKGVIEQLGHPKKVVNHYLDSVFKAEQADERQKAIDELAKNNPNMTTDKMSVTDTTQAAPFSKTIDGLHFDNRVDNCKNRPSYNSQEYRWGNGEASICDYKFSFKGEEVSHSCQQGSEMDLSVAVVFNTLVEKPIYGLTIKTTDGTVVYATNTRLQEKTISKKEHGYCAVIDFSFTANLIAANYFISIGIAVDHEDKDHVPLDRRYDLIHMKVEDNGHAFGLAMLDCNIAEKIL